MGLDVGLVGGKNYERRAQVHRRNGDVGLVVFTEPLKEKDVRFEFAFNPDFGVEMAINGAFSGTAELIHNGLDTTLWTGSNITGNKVTFNNADIGGDLPIAGSQQVKIDNPASNDVWQFDKGSNLDLNNYIAISMKILVDKDWSALDSVVMYGWDTGTGLQVGNSVAIENYFSPTAFDTIQGLAIPLADMGLSTSTVDSFRMELAIKGGGKAPKFYIDTLQVEESTGGATFTIEAPVGTKYFIDALKFTFIDAIDTTLANSSMHNLSYDKILNVGKLSNGISFSRVKDNNIAFSGTITCLADLTRSGGMIENVFGDGTNAHVTVSVPFAEPVLIDSRDNDVFNITVNDDLSGLLSFFVTATGYTIEVRNHLQD